MAPSTNEDRLSWSERFKVVGLSLGFMLVLGFLGWLFWTFNPIRNADQIWQGFWEPMGVGRYRIPKGIVILFTLVCYLILLPVAGLLFVAGVFQGLRGRRTRLAAWFLREMSQEEVRKRHERRLRSLEAKGALSQTDKALQSYLPPAVGWAIFLGVLIVAAAVLVWSATRE